METPSRRVALPLLVLAIGGIGLLLGAGLLDLTDRSGLRTLATVTTGFVADTSVETGSEVTLPPTAVVTTEQEDARLRAQFPALPAVDYDRSFLLLGAWDSCPRDRAFVYLAADRLWVDGEETDTLCAAPETTISPVVINWSATGDSFSYLAFDDPTSVIQVVRDRATLSVTKLSPVADRHGRERGLPAPGPEPAEAILATTADERDALTDHDAFPASGRAALIGVDDPVLLVVTNGCAPAWFVGVSDGAVRILRRQLEWTDCDRFTSSALFVLDDRVPRPLPSVGVDDFLAEPALALVGP